MYHHAVVLASLACIGQGLPAEFSNQRSQARPVGPACADCSQSTLKALVTLVRAFHPAAAFSLSHQGAHLVRGSPVRAKASPATLDLRNHHGELVMAEATAKVGAPGKSGFNDMKSFQDKPPDFCKERFKNYGSTFITGAYGGATMSGDAKAYEKMAGTVAKETPRLAAPFGWVHPDVQGLKADDLFNAHQENYNFFLYDGLIRLIPKIVERGFAPLVDIQPLIDERPRELKEVLRKVIFLGAAPYFFGVNNSLDLSAKLRMNSTEQLLNSYAVYSRFLLREGDKRGDNDPPRSMPPFNSFGFAIAVKKSFGLGAGTEYGDAPRMRRGIRRLVKEQNIPIDGDELLFQLASSVEQTVALTCNMMTAGRKHELIEKLRDEFLNELKGMDPKAGFTPAELAQLELFDSFSKEVMRVYPPTRPSPRFIGEPLDGDGYSLAAGTLVAPEPFVAHFDPAIFDNATGFNAARFLGENSTKAASLIPFASAPNQVPGLVANEGEQLMVIMAKVAWQQIYRMYQKVGWPNYEALEPVFNPVPDYPIATVKEKLKVTLIPRSFYLMQRPITFDYAGWGGVG